MNDCNTDTPPPGFVDSECPQPQQTPVWVGKDAAWAHFWINHASKLKPRPKELSNANQAFLGKVVTVKGKPVVLGHKRMAALMEKYAPGVYSPTVSFEIKTPLE